MKCTAAFSRAKLDVNREVQEATQSEAGAVAAFNLYHSHIRRAKERIGGRGVLFDIHGQVLARLSVPLPHSGRIQHHLI